MPRYVVPDTVEHALELLDAGLLHRNHSSSVPRNPTMWGPCSDDEVLGDSIRRAYGEESHNPTGVTWCRDDFAYVLED